LIYGIGVDLVEVARMERALCGRGAQRFISRVFSPEEISACRQTARPAECYAARFAAKEAVAKALGIGFSRGVAPGMILVRRGERTGPRIELVGKALELASSLLLTSIHVSLTHTSTAACAFVVAEREGG
jgi:holo-[acyl-carrier protein] synthase